jgi:hypothetical protein
MAPHQLLKELFARYEEAERQALQLKAKHEWEQAHPGRSYKGAAPRFGSWERFSDDGQIVAKTHRKSVLRVSLQTCSRALQLLNAITFGLEERSYQVRLSKEQGRLEAERDRAVLWIRVAEKFEVGSRMDVRPWRTEPERIRTLVPTGRLSIGVEPMGPGETVITDSRGRRLEDRWGEFWAAVEQRFQQSRQALAEQERWRQEREAREQARLERERLEAEQRRLAQVEQANRLALVTEARDWETSRVLLAYLEHIESRRLAGGTPTEGYDSWRQWALGVAAALDRSASRVDHPCTVPQAPSRG